MRNRTSQKRSEAVESKDFNELDEPCNYRYSVGSTALAMKLLELDGMPFDLSKSVFAGSLQTTMDFLNLAIRAAITVGLDYLEGPDVSANKYLGYGCLNSKRVPEFLEDLNADVEAFSQLAKTRVTRIKPQKIMALETSLFDIDCKPLSLSRPGKFKSNIHELQLNYSMLVSDKDWQALGCQLHMGDLLNFCTSEASLAFWKGIGIGAKDPVIVIANDCIDTADVIELNSKGFQFVASVMNSLPIVWNEVDQHNSDYYQAESVLPGYGVYGKVIKANFDYIGKSIELPLFIYRDPLKETELAMRTVKSLESFEKRWAGGCDDLRNSPLLSYYVNPIPGKPLKRDTSKIQDSHLTDGYIALTSNVAGLGKENAIQAYNIRKDVEVYFRDIFNGLMHSYSIQTQQEVQGIFLVTFVAISILVFLRTRMESPLLTSNGSSKSLRVKDVYTIDKIFTQLGHIELEREGDKCKLFGVTEEDEDLVASLGLKGLFSNAKAVDQLLTASYLSQIAKTKY